MALLLPSRSSAVATAALLLLRLPLLFLFHRSVSASPVATEFLYPNFTASNTGVFLTSRNATFHATFYGPSKQYSNFYLAVIHVPTNTITWSANRDSPISNSGTVVLTPSGLSVFHLNGSLDWSTPPLHAPVRALRLLDSGNLILVGADNASLWQSFDHPTDTLLSDQPLPAGSSLVSPTSTTDLSAGEYRLLVTPLDVVMQWTGSQQYWSLSSDARSFKDTNAVVSYMAANATGLYLFSGDGKAAVFWLKLHASDFRIITLDSGGRLRIRSYYNSSSSSPEDEFVAPSSDCDLPFNCMALGLCVTGSNGSICTCPNVLEPSSSPSGGCTPADGSVLASCTNGNISSSSVLYLSFGSGVTYFANKFASPSASGEDILACRELCSANCSCLGFFYFNSSTSCYLLETQLGSLSSSSTDDAGDGVGYIKTVVSESSVTSNNSTKTNLVAILLPSIAASLFLAFLFLWWRRVKRRRFGLVTKEIHLGRQKSAGDAPADGEEISIPGLPTRFSYVELEAATQNFRTKIGSGGFGEVYKGFLPDKTAVAVKRITGVGSQGRREFCTEIAVIGNIHHVNLVRLRGFCAEGSRRLLVYDYMNRGSLDRLLFGPGPALEWDERVEIAVGAARGLAYLHTGCERRIVHCDVKPENILLHDGGEVKLADFGLAKLLTPDQSGMLTTMRGTRGYLAPEWLTISAISDKTDVYSYGMVLLEIVRGRKNRSSETASAESGSSRSVGSGYFPMMALEMHERGQYLELADPRLEGRVTAEEVGRVVRVALCCLHEEPGLRPSMAVVAGMLEGRMEVWEPRVDKLGFLRLYGRGFAEMGSGGWDVFVYGGQQVTASVTSSAATTSGSVSNLSSQQVSGPR